MANEFMYKVNVEWLEKVSDDIYAKPLAQISRILKGADNIAIELHNMAASALNPHYAEWNKEADSLEGADYYEFLSKKQNEILKQVQWPDGCYCVSMTICGDPCIIVPHVSFKGNPAVYAASITIKPV